MFKLTPKAKQKVYKKDDIINFGQYKGDTVGYVMEEDPLYLEYLDAKSSYFKLDPALKEELFLRCALASEVEEGPDIVDTWSIY